MEVYQRHLHNQCIKCNSELSSSDRITKTIDGAVCLKCSGLDHLDFLHPGDACLTRRSKKISKISAVVLEYSKSRKRYERKGILVEKNAILKATEECEADKDKREKKNIIQAKRREKQEKEFIANFAERIREIYPNAPNDVEFSIAFHACEKYSGRVGRSSMAKQLENEAIRRAVIAHIRHTETNYDEIILTSLNKSDARDMVSGVIQDVLKKWS